MMKAQLDRSANARFDFTGGEPSASLFRFDKIRPDALDWAGQEPLEADRSRLDECADAGVWIDLRAEIAEEFSPPLLGPLAPLGQHAFVYQRQFASVWRWYDLGRHPGGLRGKSGN